MLRAIVTATALTVAAVIQAADHQPDRTDRQFLEKAAKTALKAVAISETVMGKLSSPSDRDFARSIIADDSTANRELMALAARKNVTLPAPDTEFTRKWSDAGTQVDEDYLK